MLWLKSRYIVKTLNPWVPCACGDVLTHCLFSGWRHGWNFTPKNVELSLLIIFMLFLPIISKLHPIQKALIEAIIAFHLYEIYCNTTFPRIIDPAEQVHEREWMWSCSTWTGSSTARSAITLQKKETKAVRTSSIMGALLCRCWGEAWTIWDVFYKRRKQR